MLAQEFLVNAGPDIKALRKGRRVQEAQVAVAHLVAAQQNQVVHGRVVLVYLVGALPGGHIHLAADDGLDPLRLARLVEVHHAVHDAVVGDGHGALAQLLHPLDQQGNAAGPVQQGIFGMDMQVDKGH